MSATAEKICSSNSSPSCHRGQPDCGLRGNRHPAGSSEGAVKVAVHGLRQRYREVLRAEIADTVASPGEVEDEIRNLFTALADELIYDFRVHATNNPQTRRNYISECSLKFSQFGFALGRGFERGHLVKWNVFNGQGRQLRCPPFYRDNHDVPAL